MHTFKHEPEIHLDDQLISHRYNIAVKKNDNITFHKYAVISSSFNHKRKRLQPHVEQQLKKIAHAGFEQLLDEQADYWAGKWEQSDILIEGDEAAQQAIRFNIFQLYQTYT